MLPALAIGAVVLLGLALMGKPKGAKSGGTTSEGVDQANKGEDPNKVANDVFAGIGAGVSAAGSIGGSVAGIISAFGGTGSAVTGGAATAGATGATATGTTVAAPTTTVAPTATATAAPTTVSVAMVETAAVISAAEIAATAGFMVVVIAWIVAMILLEQYGAAYFPADMFRTMGAKRRLRHFAFTVEEQFIADLFSKTSHPVNLSLTYDGVTNDVGEDISRFNIPVENKAQYYISRFPADKEAQRILLNFARCIALTKVEAQNEYLRSYYYVRNFSRIQNEGNLRVEDAINATDAQMQMAGVALTEFNFVAWRDNEYFPSLERRAWKTEQVVGFDRLTKTAKTAMVDTVFNDPPMYWQECVNVFKARIPNADMIRAKLRVVAHGEAINQARHHSDKTLSLDEQRRILERIGGYNKRPSGLVKGEYDYVDQVTGWFFSPNMVLRDNVGNVIQTRVS